jgi:hypothetical protein
MTRKTKWWPFRRKQSEVTEADQTADDPRDVDQSMRTYRKYFSDFIIYYKYPYLICMNTKSIYRLQIGRTAIGSTATNDIVIGSMGIEPVHCFIDTSIDPEHCHRAVLEPKARLCTVDGVMVDSMLELKLGSF